MNFAHLHLILNHLPVVGIPVALAFLLYGLKIKNHSLQRFSYLVLIALALLVLPVYFTGEPAEEVVEHLPGVAESLIEAHEDAAQISLVLTMMLGAGALAGLFFSRDEKKSRILSLAVVTLAVVSVASLLYTANLGGKIRHTELRSGAAIESAGNVEAEKSKDQEDD
jgi:uncharacterized membrane protein